MLLNIRNNPHRRRYSPGSLPYESAAPSHTPPPLICSPAAPVRTSHLAKPVGDTHGHNSEDGAEYLIEVKSLHVRGIIWPTSSSLAISSAGVITSSWVSSWLKSLPSSDKASDMVFSKNTKFHQNAEYLLN